MSSIATNAMSVSRLVCPVKSVVKKASKLNVKSSATICPNFQSQQQLPPSTQQQPLAIEKEYKEIPSARHLPFIGTTLDLVKAGGAPFLHKYCDQRHKTLGPLFREKIGSLDCVFLSDASLMAKVYSNEGQYPVHSVPEPWTIFNDMKGIQRGLFFMDGPEWSHRRKSLNRIFLKKETVSGFSNEFNDVISDLLSRWTLTSTGQTQNRDQKSGHDCNLDGVEDRVTLLPDLERELYNWSIESLGTMIFGKRLGCVANKSIPASLRVDTIHEFVQCIRQLFVESAQMTVIPAKLAYSLNLPVWRRFVGAAEKALTLARTYVEDNVEEMLSPSSSSATKCPFNSRPDKGVLQYLTDKEKIDKEEVVNIITDLFLAAADTTSHATQWALYLLARSPESQEKLYEEVCRVIGDNPVGDLKEEHLKEMPFVKGVIKESLRLYPVAPFLSRVLDKEITLNGYKVPAGKLIVMSLYSTGRDSTYFEDAETFRPERWLRDPKTKQHSVEHAHAFIPFGVGVRSCIGRRVAEMQMQFFLAKVVQRFRLQTEKEVGIRLRMITTPEEPIQLKLVPRS